MFTREEFQLLKKIPLFIEPQSQWKIFGSIRNKYIEVEHLEMSNPASKKLTIKKSLMARKSRKKADNAKSMTQIF